MCQYNRGFTRSLVGVYENNPERAADVAALSGGIGRWNKHISTSAVRAGTPRRLGDHASNLGNHHHLLNCGPSQSCAVQVSIVRVKDLK